MSERGSEREPDRSDDPGLDREPDPDRAAGSGEGPDRGSDGGADAKGDELWGRDGIVYAGPMNVLAAKLRPDLREAGKIRTRAQPWEAIGEITRSWSSSAPA